MKSRPLYFVRANKKSFGGAEIYLERLFSELQKRGIQGKILHSPFPRFLPSWLRALLFSLWACLTKKSRFYFSLDRLTCPDLYRAGDGVHRAYMEIEGRSRFTPLNLVYSAIEKRMFHRARHIIAISEMVKSDIMRHYAIPPEKISVIYNGIPLPPFDSAASKVSLIEEFSLDSRAVIFLFVGSGYQRKGVKSFLEILSRLEGEFHGFIIGKERHMERYQAHAARLGIASKVHFLGARRDVNRFYAGSDIFLFPTKYEPFGNVILEAMHHRNVIITTRQCGGGELIDPTCLMEHQEDYSIVPTIQGLLDEECSRIALQESNHHKAQEFPIEKNATQTLAILMPLLEA